MLCKSCGKEIDDGSKFCRFCGQVTTTTGSVPAGKTGASSSGTVSTSALPQKKKHRALKAVIAVIVIIIIACAAVMIYRVNDSAPSQNQTNAAAPESKAVESVTVKTEAYTDTASDGATLNMKIPQISGMGDAAFEKKINQEIIKDTKYLKEDFTQYCKDLEADGYSAMAYSSDPIEYSATTKVGENGNGILSLTVSCYEYTGGAHGDTYLACYNVDLRNNRKIKLSDLISDYSAAIAEFQRYAEENNYSIGAIYLDKTKENDFYIEDNQVVVNYGAYDLQTANTNFPVPNELLTEKWRSRF